MRIRLLKNKMIIKEQNDNLTELKEYSKEIREVYAAIAAKIEQLVELLNNPSAESSDIIQSLTVRILEFLGEITTFVKKERKMAKNKRWSKSKKKTFLALIKKELEEINTLIIKLKIEQNHPGHPLVAAIYSLNKKIKEDIAAEEAVLN